MAEALPDRGDLLTEQRLGAAVDLDRLPVEQVLRLINDQDQSVPAAVAAAIGSISRLVQNVIASMRGGGRLIYVGAGTSGRLGVLDASECPPTFYCEPDCVIGIIAGGDRALRQSSEAAEDDAHGARSAFDELDVAASDVVVGIAAGGTTPFVRGALVIARQRGATTGLICCVPSTQLGGDPPFSTCADHVVAIEVGPEVLAGSTRMKAGTATKLVLNMISTATMVQLGKAWGNLMVDLRATNQKLLDRAARMVMEHGNVSRHQALQLLIDADGRVKTALVMAIRRVDANVAQSLLGQHGQNLRATIGDPKS